MGSSGQIRAGQAYVEIFAADSKFQQSMTRIRTTVQAVGQQIRRAGTGMFLGGAAIGAPMVAAVRQFAAFDDAIRASAAAAGKGAGDLSAMGGAAERLAMQFGMAATDVANLGLEVARAFGDKLTQTQINDVTAAVIALSKATGTDGTRSASIMASTLAQFGLGAGQASRVADVLTFTANATLNSVDSLGEALKYAGTNAALAGVDIEQTAAILGTLGNLGVQGSDAGTALKRLLIITGAEAEKLKGIFGVSFLDMNGNVRPLVDTLDEVSRSMQGMGSGEQLRRMNDAFGLLGISAAVGIGKAGDATRKLESDIRKATGTAVKQAEFMNAGVGGAMRSVTTSVGILANAFGAALDPAIRSTAGYLVGVSQAFANLAQENPALAQAIGKTAAALVAGGAAAIALGSALQGVGTIVGVAAGSLALLANPAVLTGILAVATAIGTVTFAARQVSPEFVRISDEWLKMVGIMEANPMPGQAAGGEDKQLSKLVTSNAGMEQLRQLRRDAVAGNGGDLVQRMRDIARNEIDVVRAHPRMSDAEKRSKETGLSLVLASLDAQIAADAKAARAAEETAAAAEKVAAETKRRAAITGELNDEQQKEVDRIREENKTPQQRLADEISRLASMTSDTGKGLSQDELDAAIARAKEKAQQEIDAANKKQNEERDRIAKDAERVRADVATPEEKLAARIEELKKLPLDPETFSRAVAQAKADTVDSLSRDKPERQGIASAGTFGDAALLGIGPEIADPVKETAENTRRMVDELAAMAIANGPAPLVAAPGVPLQGIGAEVAAPRVAEVKQAAAAGAELAAQTVTLTNAVNTMAAQMTAAIGKTTQAVESTVSVLQKIADNTANLGGAFL